MYIVSNPNPGLHFTLTHKCIFWRRMLAHTPFFLDESDATLMLNLIVVVSDIGYYALQF